MLDQFKEIIANLTSDSTLYLSNFTPHEALDYCLKHNFSVQLLPSTLQGDVDTKRVKPFDPQEKAVLIIWPSFYHDNERLRSMQSTNNFTLFSIKSEQRASSATIQTLFKHQLKESVDLDLGNINSADFFIIYLRPHMFCPKEDILTLLREKGVGFHTDLPSLYKHSYFESQKRSHMTAHECHLSFIALDCKISEAQAFRNAQILLEALQSHALRRCSF